MQERKTSVISKVKEPEDLPLHIARLSLVANRKCRDAPTPVSTVAKSPGLVTPDTPLRSTVTLICRNSWREANKSPQRQPVREVS